MPDITLWGFDGSTYVRTVKMLLAEKGVTEFTQVPLNVLAGEPRTEEHLERHPFGKVPVVDYDGLRLLETSAITRYLNDKLPGPSLVPQTAEDRARMDMVIGITDSYGYGSLLGIAGYHLFPDFIGGRDDAKLAAAIETAGKVLAFVMQTKGSSPFVAGDLSLADLYLAPCVFYLSLTPDAEDLFATEGFADWWERVQALPSYQATVPSFG
jgi:glutathione S-transferase